MDRFDYQNEETEIGGELKEEEYRIETKPAKRHKRRAFAIIAIAFGAILTVSAVAFAAYRFGAGSKDKNTEASKSGIEFATNISEEKGDLVSELTTLPEAVEKAESSSPLILTSRDIENTDTSANTVVLDVSEVVENVMPCVVAITDNLELTTSNSYNPYSYYFGGSRGSETRESAADGSGVIIAENEDELLIVTNNHVVDNEGNYSYYSVSSTGLTVQFVDGKTASATVRGTDSDEDLAVISVKISDLDIDTRDAIRVAVCGNSDEMKVGAGVIAIGNAMGYGQSVTTGIISAKDRAVTIDGITRYLMQTDAAINPGNSGGGLFNAKGELIGINSAKRVDTSVEGMGFAIPITTVSDIIENLMNYVPIPEEDQGYLGINGETIPDNYIEGYDYPKGVSITKIGEGSPAENAGLQIYDIITSIDGKQVESMNGLKKLVNGYAAGSTVTVGIARPDGRGFRELEVEVTLARYSELSDSVVTQTTAPETEVPESNWDFDWFGDDEGSNSFFDWLLERLN